MMVCCIRGDLQLDDDVDDRRSGSSVQLWDNEQFPTDVVTGPPGTDQHDCRHFGQLLCQRRMWVKPKYITPVSP